MESFICHHLMRHLRCVGAASWSGSRHQPVGAASMGGGAIIVRMYIVGCEYY